METLKKFYLQSSKNTTIFINIPKKQKKKKEAIY